MAEKKGPLSEPKYKAELARNHLLARTQGIDAVMTKYRLDALVAPTGGPAWLIDLVNGDGGTAAAPGPSTVTSVAGYPHITVPMGYVGGLPVGISFFGRAWSEPTLIRLAYAYEQATKHRRPPTFAPTADLTNRRADLQSPRTAALSAVRYSRALPDGAADEERTEAFEVERRLLRLPHRLHERRQRIQVLPDQADDEVVVALVEAVAGQADVVRVVAGAVRHADRAVLGEDDALLVGGQRRELPAPPQRIPDAPTSTAG